ncbi:hypothetical protein B381_01624 [Stutzerimonas stutzeri NF13]|uniref:Uncharacterized protein n=1 Tax=Stutzerimonas stutzeri NF13 TaxID=1212548 RepID=M2VQI6_STUST|nr:hypothetical protein B381_01624 [Stutzerimonas stutzeri NF13]
MAGREACALPQAVQGEDAGQVLVDRPFEFLARIGAQGAHHEKMRSGWSTLPVATSRSKIRLLG